MIRIDGLFETHLTVSDLDRSVTFYRDVLGLRVASIFPERQVAFFWIGHPDEAMLGLWATGSGPQRMTLHLAFRVSLDAVLEAPRALRAAGITPLDFGGQPTNEPVVLAWMPAAAVYFLDPDANLLELLAMLEDSPRPDGGIVRWSDWAPASR